MAFDDMPDLGPMAMPGAMDYARTCLERARAAAADHDVRMDLHYGTDRFQGLDVWLPKTPPAAPMPVVVFVHGGGLRNGHKEWIGFMAPAVCALPAVLVSPNHRLTPRVRAADALADLMDAVAWVSREIGRFGGDPGRIVLAGHSAGGYLAALAALDRDGLARLGVPPASVRACMPVGGMFTMRREDVLPTDVLRTRLRGDLVASDEEAERVTAYGRAAGNAVPFHLTRGERDIPEILPDNLRMAEVARENGFLDGVEVLPGLDHFGAHLACADPDGPWMRALRRLAA